MMNLGRKKYRKPVSYLRYLNSSGVYENYQITKQGFKKIDNINQNTETTNNQIYLIDPNSKQTNNENNLSDQIISNNYPDNDNYLNSQLNLNKESNEKINNEISGINNLSNQANFNNYQSKYVEEQQNLTINPSNTVTTQISYPSTPNMSQNVNSSKQYNSQPELAQNQIVYPNNKDNSNFSFDSNINTENLQNCKSIHPNLDQNQFNLTNSQNINTENNSTQNDQTIISQYYNIQQKASSGFIDQSLYEKIMSDNLNLVIKECHLIQPDEVLVLYKIVPD